MDDQTPLDKAFAAMQDTTHEETRRLQFFECVADAELYLLLKTEPDGDDISPEVFAPDGLEIVLAFDTEDRLTSFTGVPSPYVALSGRSLVSMLRGKGLGIGLNLGVAKSEYLLEPNVLEWLGETLDKKPDEMEARPIAFHMPTNIPEILLESLAVKLANANRIVDQVLLTGVTYEGGKKGHLLAFIEAKKGAQPALAKAVNEALTFSGLEAGILDVVFLNADEPAALAIIRYGVELELPKLPENDLVLQKPPGSDPDVPPKLK